MPRLLFLALAGFLLFLTDCSNRAGLAIHLNELFARADIGRVDMSVAMSARSRTGIADFPARTGEIARIASVLRLVEVRDISAASLSQVRGWLKQARKEYGHELLRLPPGVHVYHSAVRAPSLQLRDGTRFKYLVLIWDAVRERAVVLVEYAYG
ncbi:MAG: hypothetical protein JXA28_05810 [Bacteroidetes bacterium]|nr:hypothetical protein [Bacteroidota bacterium]